MKQSIKILSVGNSFSADTMEHLPDIARSLGVGFRFANLYIGGCSVDRHYRNVVHGLAEYTYYTNTGNGWEKKEQVSIAEALQEEWDIVSIQHGTGDGSRYTSPESYEKLPLLIGRIRELAGEKVKIAFNMAWVAEPESTHHEITSYGGDQSEMYRKLTSLTETLVAPMVDAISPAGTAVQNARAYLPQKLTRDDFHLSYGLGRYIAGLTFLQALCGTDISAVNWCPEGVTEQEREIAKKAAEAAVRTPFAVSPLPFPAPGHE